MTSWIEALKIYNKGQQWCVPKKGSPEHAEVMKIMKGGKVESTPTPPKKSDDMEGIKFSKEQLKEFAERRKARKAEKEVKVSAFMEKMKGKKKEKVKAFLRSFIDKKRDEKMSLEEKIYEGKAPKPTTIEGINKYASWLDENLGRGAGADYINDYMIEQSEAKKKKTRKEGKDKNMERLKDRLSKYNGDKKKLMARLLDELSGDWETHEYKLGLGYPTPQFVKAYRDNLPVPRDAFEEARKAYNEVILDFIHKYEKDATWAGKPQKIILDKDFQHILGMMKSLIK